MTSICPQCEEMREIDAIRAEEEITVRGESLKVTVKYLRCRACGEEYLNLSDENDPLDAAYREYRRLHGMLQPEEIRELRKRYGLTQKEMNDLLGWGGATLSRYENGALQDEAHDRLLQFIREPRNLGILVAQKPGAVSESTRRRVEESLNHIGSPSLEAVYEIRFGSYAPDIESGYRKLDLTKLYQAILFFCQDWVVKTKLNKLLFYADFKHFKEYTISITGARYARLPFGPVPDNYELFYAALIEERKEITVREVSYGEDCVGEEFKAIGEPDLSIFSDTELMVLNATGKYFKNYSARKISDLSHREKGYEETPDNQFISYDYSRDLQR
jgi:putative zinc finger/helix-turn-helix YgiT family protein